MSVGTTASMMLLLPDAESVAFDGNITTLAEAHGGQLVSSTDLQPALTFFHRAPCNIDADCNEGVACAVDRCVSGMCTHDVSACGGPGPCPLPDAGPMLDGGMSDAGFAMDGGPGDAGSVMDGGMSDVATRDAAATFDSGTAATDASTADAAAPPPPARGNCSVITTARCRSEGASAAFIAGLALFVVRRARRTLRR